MNQCLLAALALCSVFYLYMAIVLTSPAPLVKRMPDGSVDVAFILSCPYHAINYIISTYVLPILTIDQFSVFFLVLIMI